MKFLRCAVPLLALLLLPAAATAQSSGFASSLAVSGDDLLVGRRGSAFSPAGAVHVYRRAGDGSWRESGTFTGEGTKSGEGFGTALAASGNLVAVSAPAHGEGAVFVFERRGTGYAQVAKLVVPGTTPADGFGTSLALDGSTLLVGAPGRDSLTGTVYAFERDARGAWSAPTAMGTGTAFWDRAGTALALAGNMALVGMPGPPTNLPARFNVAPRSGSVVVFRRNGGSWTEAGRLEPPAADSVRGFGATVLLSESRAFVGVPTVARNAGTVYEYRASGSGWGEASRIVPSTPEPNARFGTVLAAGSGTLMVGAPGMAQLAGGVFTFTRQGDAWVQGQTILAGDMGANARLGTSMAFGPSVAVIGAPGASGGVVYTRDAAGGWREGTHLFDTSADLPAISGGMVRCDSTASQAAGFACNEVDLLSFMPIATIGGDRSVQLNDIWGWTDPQSNREYALVGRTNGTAFVDVTDPANPVFVGDLPLTAGARPSSWRDIKVYKDHAFIVADASGQHGMQVFDLTRLRNPGRTATTFTADTTYARIASAHNIAINEATGYAYVIGSGGGGETCGGALHMIDIREPKVPKFAGCFADVTTGNQRTGYTHDNQCVVYHGPDTRYTGREICFNASETAVGIADVTDKANPKAIAVASYPNTQYAHQGWLSEDQRYFYLNDEGDEGAGVVDRTRTIIWDMSKLDEPVLVKEFLGETGAIDHNMYIRGNYMYQSNYVAGLRVIDISDPVNPKEVGFFDTVPWGENGAGFAGSWSNYPYFKSGTIVVTSIGEGLFVLRHRQMPLVP